MSSNDYVVIFDTNKLFVNYTNSADFTKFNFNLTLNKIIEKVEVLDIYSEISIAIPIVVWEEMKKQEIDAYHKKIKENEEIFKKMSRHKFPNLYLNIEKKDIAYESYIDEKIKEYQNQLKHYSVKIFNLDLPSENKFEKIIKRAFEKKAPFEGIDKRSDKGFKDALLWESVIEFKEKNPNSNIIFYCNDKNFCEILKQEYLELFNCDIHIISEEEDIYEQLKIWSKELGKTPIPDNEYDDPNYQLIENWLKTDDFHVDFNYFQNLFKTCNENEVYDHCTIVNYDIDFVENEDLDSHIYVYSDMTKPPEIINVSDLYSGIDYEINMKILAVFRSEDFEEPTGTE
ncbi:hypothetical protein MmiAt1_11230 [Methanimicrococcus sp. At1]|uniref:DUF4935 domain-containing protein n=1 Tax=Methanimicrococcus hacksteinii TaxID=3028293 RepID=A0ABU3VRL0_9EURY|nr:PIN domain-containing protein [Methanimicrococcus sp. At1]MDV0445540.1 hypothetical protein [Methanimicrococcus sp. At1]